LADNKKMAREILKSHMEKVIATTKTPFLVTTISSKCPEVLDLPRGSRMCKPAKASLIIVRDGDGNVRARSHVPKV
jgi:hypothetical protein